MPPHFRIIIVIQQFIILYTSGKPFSIHLCLLDREKCNHSSNSKVSLGVFWGTLACCTDLLHQAPYLLACPLWRTKQGEQHWLSCPPPLRFRCTWTSWLVRTRVLTTALLAFFKSWGTKRAMNRLPSSGRPKGALAQCTNSWIWAVGNLDKLSKLKLGNNLPSPSQRQGP